jgi:drug/metabolite transporter superfamily protein YnfA
MGVFFAITIIFSAFVKRSVPSVFQIVGPFVFIGGYFLLLA